MYADFYSTIFNIFLFIGVIVALKDRGRINQLVDAVTSLQTVIEQQAKRIEKLTNRVNELSSTAPNNNEDKPSDKAEVKTKVKTQVKSSSFDADHKATSVTTPDQHKTADNPWEGASRNDESKPKPQTEQQAQTEPSFSFEQLLKGNGIFWLGAMVLAIGGVFLAKYSIEAGLLPPSVRVMLGSIFGVSLVICAEYVNKFKDKLNIQTPYISAALASGGVITCFAMAFVAFDFYEFITPNIAFVLLALISIAATYLALRFGPLLAGIGIIGSYAVPALVSTGSNNVVALLLYVSFVSLSAVWIAEYVKQKWLWWQSFAGHFLWFAAAIVIGGKSDFAILMLFAFVSIYLYVLAGLLGWKLNLTLTEALPVRALIMPRKEQVVILLCLFLTAIYLVLNHEFSHIVLACLSLSVLVMLVSYRHSALDSWPYLMLAFALFAFSLMPNIADFCDHLFPFTGKYLFIQIAVLIAMLFSGFMIKHFDNRNAYLLLLVMAPVSLYGLSYITSSTKAEVYLYPVWAIEMLLIGAAASILAMRAKRSEQQVTYLILANSVLTLCFTMLLSASTLTIVLAAQVASMSYLSWKYKVSIPDWIYKLALIAVVTRLTLAPWLAEYKDGTILNVHWTLIVYPVVLAIIWFATKYNPSKQLNAWFMGVLIHVIALFVTTETSYLLIGDYPDFFDLSYKESVLLAFNWLVLSAVYFWRSHLTTNMTKLYRVGGMVLLLGATLIHFDISMINSPFFVDLFVGTGLMSWLVLQWLLPAGVLIGFIYFKLVDKKFDSFVYGAIAFLAASFINGEIRSMFNQGYLLWETPLKQAELYTYSIVWLVISTITIFTGQRFDYKQLVNAGFIGLALVMLKAFGVDMAHLEGLLRALSFIGLGLCLVAIGWLFQKIQHKPELDEVSANS